MSIYRKEVLHSITRISILFYSVSYTEGFIKFPSEVVWIGDFGTLA